MVRKYSIKANIRLGVALFSCPSVALFSSVALISLTTLLDKNEELASRTKYRLNECVCVFVCACVCPYRIGSFAFPAVWVESFLFICEGFGLHSKRSPLLTSHFLPPLTEEDADRSKRIDHMFLFNTREYTIPIHDGRDKVQLQYLLSLPGYICVYSTLNFLANSMKAFIGRLHLLAVALLPGALSCWLLVGF